MDEVLFAIQGKFPVALRVNCKHSVTKNCIGGCIAWGERWEVEVTDGVTEFNCKTNSKDIVLASIENA